MPSVVPSDLIIYLLTLKQEISISGYGFISKIPYQLACLCNYNFLVRHVLIQLRVFRKLLFSKFTEKNQTLLQLNQYKLWFPQCVSFHLFRSNHITSTAFVRPLLDKDISGLRKFSFKMYLASFKIALNTIATNYLWKYININ